MTDEILEQANGIKMEIKRTNEILDVLYADDLEISIAGTIKGVSHRNTWYGYDDKGIEFKKALIRTASEKLSRYIEEFNAL